MHENNFKAIFQTAFLVPNVPLSEETTLLRTSVVRFLEESAEASFAPGSSFPALVQVCWMPLFCSEASSWHLARVAAHQRACWRCLVSQSERCCERAVLAATGRALQPTDQRRPSGAARSFLWSGLRLQTAVIEATVSGCGVWKCECKCDQCENRLPRF